MGMATGKTTIFDPLESSVIAYRRHSEMLEKEVKWKHHFENIANRQAREIKSLKTENEMLRAKIKAVESALGSS